MKKFIIGFIILIFTLTVIPVADAGKKDKRYKKHNSNRQHQYDQNYRNYHQKNDWHRGRNGRWKGHRQGPPRGRHYDSHRYRGHWRSWSQWKHHYDENRHRYRDGKYHHDNRGYMMFSFCEGEGVCFSFSISD